MTRRPGESLPEYVPETFVLDTYVSPRHRCQCKPPNGQCRDRATQEDMLCDRCRTDEFCRPFTGGQQ